MTRLHAERADAHRPSEVLNALKRLGFGAVVSVPDGWLGQILERIEEEPAMRLVRATHEEEDAGGGRKDYFRDEDVEQVGH